MSEISGKLINVRYRIPGSATEKTIVCTEDSTFTLEVDISERETNCGIKTNPGIPKFSASGNAVHNVEPTASEASYNDIKELIKAGTKVNLMYISEADAGNGFSEAQAIYNKCSGYFNQVEANASASSDGILGFSWSFTGTGTLDAYDES